MMRTLPPALRTPSAAFAGLAVLLQILWPLTTGDARVAVTLLSVTTLWASSVLHLTTESTVRTTAVAAGIVGFIGVLVEVIGSKTGILFGEYDYTGILQPTIFEVPVAVVLAWFMMSWPIFALTRRVFTSSSRIFRIVFASALMTSWDLFLDPQMVGENYWIWNDTGADLPGIPGIPLSNYFWWFIVSAIVMSVFEYTFRISPTSIAVPSVVLAWTWFGGVVAHGVFWQNVGAALWGGIIMGGLLGYLAAKASATEGFFS